MPDDQARLEKSTSHAGTGPRPQCEGCGYTGEYEMDMVKAMNQFQEICGAPMSPELTGAETTEAVSRER